MVLLGRSPKSQTCSHLGFTLPDLLSCLAILCVITSLLFVGWINTKQRVSLAQCSGNLQQIGRALLLYSNDNSDKLPQGLSTPGVELWWSYKVQVRRYLSGATNGFQGEKLFACPADRGYSDPKPFSETDRFSRGSYPYNAVTAWDAPNIAGWPLHDIIEPAKTLLVMEWCAHAPLSWHKSRTGKRNLPFYCDAESVVTFADGHTSLTRIYYDGFNAAYTRDPISGYNYRYSGN